jgi:hypothetical protein
MSPTKDHIEAATDIAAIETTLSRIAFRPTPPTAERIQADAKKAAFAYRQAKPNPKPYVPGKAQ